MTTHEILDELEKLPYFNSLLTSGIIPMNWMDYKVIFEFHEEEMKRLGNCKYQIKGYERQAKENTAKEFNVSERTVYAIIKKMKD